jgi:predicted nucleic acid-binding protein
LVRQTACAEVDRWFDEDGEIALWTLTPVEVVSALRRLLHDGEIRERDALHAERRADELMRACHIVVDVDAVKATAVRLLRTHTLRAADALQLGAALEWAGHRAADQVLVSFDRRLALAAEREGFRVLPP